MNTTATPPDAAVVLATAGSEDEATLLARTALQRNLAACVQVYPIRSFYMWQGAMQDDAEYLLLFKTRRSNYAQLEACIRETHSYEVPEIVLLPIEQGLPAYLAWLHEHTGGSDA